MQEQQYPESLRTKKSVLFVILAIILVLLSMVTYNTSSELNNLSTLNDTLEQLAHSQIDPCNNTYEYICQNFPSNYLTDEELNQEQLINIYNESYQHESNKLVQFAKRLFQSCMDTTTIKADGWDTLWLIFSDLGGWPWQVNGTYTLPWNRTKFNLYDTEEFPGPFKYMDIISKLRKLGIPPILLKLSVIPKPSNPNRPIHKLSIVSNDYFKEGVEGSEMINLVKMFMKTTELSKLKLAYARAARFSRWLQQFENLNHTLRTVERYALPDWYPPHIRKLLNALSGQAQEVILSLQIQLYFPPKGAMKVFFRGVTRATERIVANYIMWTVLYELAPYLHEEVRNEIEMEMTDQQRRVWCLAEVEKRFELSPISFVADQRYFTPGFRKEINEYISSLKSMFNRAVEANRYLQDYEKEHFIKEINAVVIEIARPSEYTNITTLETAIAYELVTPVYRNRDVFLTRILLANRNYDSAMYFKGSEQHDVRFDLEYVKNGHITYMKEGKFLYVPRVAIQRHYDKGLPKYFNLARLGTEIFSYLFYKFANYSQIDRASKYQRMETCMHIGIDQYTQHAGEARRNKYTYLYRGPIADDFAKQIYAGQVARASFDSNNTMAINAKYSPEKIFWFAMASNLCPRGENADKYLSEMKFYLALGTNTKFTEEFLDNCKNNSKPYIYQKARITNCGKILEF